jgi:RecJ-like exonuclease
MAPIDYDPDDAPLFGAFFACDRCEGQGVMTVAGIAGRWDETPYDNDREAPCPDCQGHGTIWVEEGC